MRLHIYVWRIFQFNYKKANLLFILKKAFFIMIILSGVCSIGKTQDLFINEVQSSNLNATHLIGLKYIMEVQRLLISKITAFQM